MFFKKLVFPIFLKLVLHMLSSAVLRKVDHGSDEFDKLLDPWLEPYQKEALHDAIYTILYETLDLDQSGILQHPVETTAWDLVPFDFSFPTNIVDHIEYDSISEDRSLSDPPLKKEDDDAGRL